MDLTAEASVFKCESITHFSDNLGQKSRKPNLYVSGRSSCHNHLFSRGHFAPLREQQSEIMLDRKQDVQMFQGPINVNETPVNSTFIKVYESIWSVLESENTSGDIPDVHSGHRQCERWGNNQHTIWLQYSSNSWRISFEVQEWNGHPTMSIRIVFLGKDISSNLSCSTSLAIVDAKKRAPVW